MPAPRILRKLARHVRPLVREKVHAALDQAATALDDEEALDALAGRIAHEIDAAHDFTVVPVIGPALEAMDGPIIEAIVHAAIDEAVEAYHKASAAARANARYRAERGV